MSFKNLNKFLKSKLLCGFHKNHNDANSKPNTMPAIISDILNVKSPDINNVKHTYNHIYRRKTKWELSRLSFAMMGIEIVYAILTAFVSPVLLMYGVKREHATLVWVIGPLMGLIFSPILGSLSDRCRFSIGRRRPFIIFLATLNVTGLLLIANSNYVGKLFGDREADIFSTTKSTSASASASPSPSPSPSSSAGVTQQDAAGTKITHYIWTVIFLIIGAVTVDFSSDTLQNPSRAYVLDVCVVEDHDKGLNTCTILAGCGGFIGYIIGAVEWHNTFLNEIIGSYMQVMFYLVAVLFVICILATVTTFRELPLKKSRHIESSTSATDKADTNAPTELTEPATKLQDYLKSIISMPYSLRILCITNLFCWMSHVTFCLYFTDFVGQAVFAGNPSAPPDSMQYKLYEEGIRFGCSALCGYSIACIAYSLVSEKIIKCLGLKCVYIGTICLNSLCLILMAAVKAKIIVIILSAISGIIYCTIVTIPYMLIAHYHVKKTFHVDKNGKQLSTTQVRGLGTDLAIVGACLCVAQLIVSSSMGKIMSLFGVTFAVIGTSAFFACLAALTAFHIVYLDL